MITDQNRTMIKLVNDFQQQMAQLARQFQTTLSDVENSYRAAYNAYTGQPMQMGMQMPMQMPMQLTPSQPTVEQSFRPRGSSSRRRYQVSDSDDDSSDYGDRKVQIYKVGSRRRKIYDESD